MDADHVDEAVKAVLPKPTDTAYRTPSRSLSRNGSMSPDVSSSPPLLPAENGLPRSRSVTPDIAASNGFTHVDPRRFTPTLHANLVGEILSLRRELENKAKDISALEEAVHNTRSENEDLTNSLADGSKEARTLKKQMQLLEGGTFSALDDLAKERDEALGTLADTRRRLEQSQKKARSYEDDMARTQHLYDNDRSRWESDKRALETKVHIVEGRLKVILSEVAASQQTSVHESPRSASKVSVDCPMRSESVASFRSFKGYHRRRASSASSGPHDPDPFYQRQSSAAPTNGTGSKQGGPSLADELAFDEEEEDNMGQVEEYDDATSPTALPEERPPSRIRSFDSKARKVLGLAIEPGQQLDLEQIHRLSLLEEADEENARRSRAWAAEYTDAAVQYSPPSSPIMDRATEETEPIKEEPVVGLSGDRLANQGRKRVSTSPSRDRTSTEDLRGANVPVVGMTSTSSQTIGDLPSPPSTPKILSTAESTSAVPKSTSEYTSRETQTETSGIVGPLLGPIPLLPIPKIAIYPPASRPTTPRDSVVLPPHTKNAACQVDIYLQNIRSTGMQTEEIRIDTRSVKLPPHLIPAASLAAKSLDKSKFDRPVVRGPPARRKYRSPPPVAPVIGSSKPIEPPLPTSPLSGPVNDTGRLTTNSKQDIARPVRTTSLFAGFEADDEGKGRSPTEDVKFDDDDFFNRPMISYTLKAGRMVNKAGATDDDDLFLESDNVSSPAEGTAALIDERLSKDLVTSSVREPYESTREEDESLGSAKIFSNRPKPLKLATNSSKPSNIRRAALISSGTAAHAARSRSPSLQGNDNPPFPVPTRHSSRKIPMSSSEGARSPTPNSQGRLSYDEEPVLRKTRSAAAIARMERQRSRSPPLLSASTIPESPDLPPMPADHVSPFGGYQTFGSPSPNQAPMVETHHSRSESSSTAVAQSTVVDAIAQTMIGEWMWKYVRRGKSFGASEVSHPDWDAAGTGEKINANITNNGTRHKRWVWLAPYERAVMWSSKQPTSGPALLGKSGRKLIIQSVLDVKDDTPMSKGAGRCFNRSILILTPQRALKFTAFTQDRHYVWLSALSFLSSSPNGLGDLSIPNLPLEDSAPPPVPSRSTRRPQIRDSIRITKTRNGLGINGVRAFTTDGNIPRIKEMDAPNLYNEYNTYDYGNDEAAEAPIVARTSMHSRKRSNTAPRPPPTSFKTYPSISSSHLPPSSKHSGSGGSSIDQNPPFSSLNGTNGPAGYPSSIVTSAPGGQSTRTSMSRRTSISSGANAQPPSGQTINNYFDQLGTVRMEAFINRGNGQGSQDMPSLLENNQSQSLFHPTMGVGQPTTSVTAGGSRTATRSSYRTRHGRKKDMSYWGANSTAPPSSMHPHHQAQTSNATSNNSGSGAGGQSSLGSAADLGSLGSRDSWMLRGEDPFRGF